MEAILIVIAVLFALSILGEGLKSASHPATQAKAGQRGIDRNKGNRGLR